MIKVGILGTRGIPNNYGGFEQFADYLSRGLQEKDCDLFVYNSHYHPFKENNYNGVKIIHKWDPKRIGLASQFIYDLLCILDARKQKFDVIIQLGYTTSSIWAWLLPKKARIIYNMDGIEWKREKYKGILKTFLKYAEKLAINRSNIVIADAEPIKTYLDNKYNTNVEFIAYAADIFINPNSDILKQYNLNANSYYLLIARFQPDNNISKIIEGIIDSNTAFPLVIIGDYNNKYGKYLRQKYDNKQIVFLGGIYNKNILDNLRYYSSLYFHGHSAGGTNPSLLEAMATSCNICAHGNEFNKSVLNNDAFFFSNKTEISEIINNKAESKNQKWIENNLNKIKTRYTKKEIINKYYKLISQ